MRCFRKTQRNFWTEKETAKPTPGFLPGTFHGQRSLAGYSPLGHRVGHGRAIKQPGKEDLRPPWTAHQEQRRRSVTAVHGGKAGPGSHIWMWQAGPKEGRREVKVVQSCVTLCNPMDYTVHGTLQARILEWIAFPFSRGSSQPRDRAQVSRVAGRFFTS